MNALKHGLRAERAVVRGESPEEFAEFSQKMLADLNPQGPVQTFFAEKAAEDMWRVQRAAFIEASIMSWSPHEIGMDQEAWDKAVEAGDEAMKERIRDGFWSKVWDSSAPAIKNLHRYETAIMRRIMQCMRELRELQKSRVSAASERLSAARAAQAGRPSTAETVLKAGMAEPSSTRHDAPHAPDSSVPHKPTQQTTGASAVDEAPTPAVVNEVSKAGRSHAEPQQDPTGAGPSALPNEPISPPKT